MSNNNARYKSRELRDREIQM